MLEVDQGEGAEHWVGDQGENKTPVRLRIRNADRSGGKGSPGPCSGC